MAIKSATEPFDTTSPIGRFVFQLLASIAELERETITERMIMGKRRVVADGKYAGGRVPIGYEVNSDGYIVSSAHVIPELGITETEMVLDLFTRIAGGSTLLIEAQRLNALGIQPRSRYGRNRKKGAAEASTYVQTSTWTPSVIWTIITNPAYKGAAVLKSKQGTVDRPSPAIVDSVLWDAAQATLSKNRLQSTRNAKYVYLLRGLIVCTSCGRHFTGLSERTRLDGSVPRRYRCNAQIPGNRPDPATRCTAKTVNADWLEDFIWQDCRAFIENPGDALADAQRQLRERLEQTTGTEGRRRELLGQIAEKDGERERVLTMYRRGRITITEAETEMDAIARETATLREMMEALRAQEALAAAQEAHLSDATTMLLKLRERIEDIEAEADSTVKRQIIELLVSRIAVETEGAGRERTATVTVTYRFSGPQRIGIASPMQSSCPQRRGRS